MFVTGGTLSYKRQLVVAVIGKPESVFTVGNDYDYAEIRVFQFSLELVVVRIPRKKIMDVCLDLLCSSLSLLAVRLFALILLLGPGLKGMLSQRLQFDSPFSMSAMPSGFENLPLRLSDEN
jgi:hypothetical protein